MTGTLIILSGLPGTGKSTLGARLASVLPAVYLRIDTVEQGLRDVCGVTQIDGKGYALSYRLAQENLKIGNIVIADSVNPEEFTRREWNAVAEEIGARFINVEIFCSDKKEHQTRIETRAKTIPGLKQPTWDDVLKREFHQWKDDRIAIDTAGKTADESFAELLSATRSRMKV